jgi:hypothetical protein
VIKQLLFWTLVSFMGLCIFSVVFNQTSATAVGFPKVFYGGNTYSTWSGNGSVLSVVIGNLIIDLLVASGVGLVLTIATAIIQKRRQ